MTPDTHDNAAPRSTDVAVLTWADPTTSDWRALKIADFCGADAAFHALAPGSSAIGQPARRRYVCAIVDAETLALASESLGEGNLDPCGLSELAEHVFVYGFTRTERHDGVLRSLSGGTLQGVEPLDAATCRFDVTATHRDWCGQFSGLSFDAHQPGHQQAFAQASGCEALIRIGGKPLFVRLDRASSNVAVAVPELADLDEPAADQPVLAWFTRLIPLVMFLRGSLKHRVWQNPQPRACVIIDDPQLQERHGFLEYRRLIDSMRRHRYATCIAFIPWNYRRSNKSVAALMTAAGGPGLCVHGCDHTRGEFAASDIDALRAKSQLALERMRWHQRESGVPFDEVMVFPQGLFSPEAMAALDASGYLAAINSTLIASTGQPTLNLRDLLEVAVTRYGGLPLFGRRYPRQLAEFAWDLFFGKPALAVEHHGYFSDGGTALESFVDRLQSLDSRLEWTTLGDICSHASLVRTSTDGTIDVRYYTRRFHLTNTGTVEQAYRLHRADSAASPASASMTLRPGQTVTLDGSPAAAEAPVSWKPGVVHAMKVAIRRRLCDIRDNHVDTNRFLSSLVGAAQS